MSDGQVVRLGNFLFLGGGQDVGKIYGVTVWGIVWGEGMCRGTSRGKCLLLMQDYKFLCVAVLTCATLVNTQAHTHRQTALGWCTGNTNRHICLSRRDNSTTHRQTDRQPC